MPFLRAALIQKKKQEEAERVNILPPIVVVPEPDAEELAAITEFNALLENAIQKVEAEEAEFVPESEELPELEPEEQEPEIESEPEPEPEEQEQEIVPESEELPELEPQEQEPKPEIEPDIPEDLGQVPQDTQDTSDAFANLPAEILAAVTEDEPAPEGEPAPSGKDYSGETLNYDFTSSERYVDKVSTKTEFDKMLDELSAISKDLLSREVEKFAVKFTSKFQGDFDKAEADAKKYEAFLGGFITNAAMTLYENGYRDSAVKQLEQAKGIIEASKRLEEETQAIRDRVEEEDATVDLSDILGLFGD